MSSHELANLLLTMPDLPIVSGLSRSGYGEEIEAADVVEAHVAAGSGYEKATTDVIELTLSESSGFSTSEEG